MFNPEIPVLDSRRDTYSVLCRRNPLYPLIYVKPWEAGGIIADRVARNKIKFNYSNISQRITTTTTYLNSPNQPLSSYVPF
jgi:hypothetical protein